MARRWSDPAVCGVSSNRTIEQGVVGRQWLLGASSAAPAILPDRNALVIRRVDHGRENVHQGKIRRM